MTAQALLKKQFGLEAFRGRQLEVIEHLAGGGDALVIWPTGFGKSLTYQMAALMGGDLAIIVSPLIALMQDQVDQARQKGLPFTFINSSLGRDDRLARLKQIAAGEWKAVYVTPERFRGEEFWQAIAGRKVTLLAVDEAHCISQWGHDFRPEYSRLGEIREKLGRPPTVALTATATQDVQKDILKVLGIPGGQVFWDGIERENLALAVHKLEADDDKLEWLIDYLKAARGPALVYFSLIRKLHEVLDAVARAGLRPEYYHGELDARERKKTQRRFLSGETSLLFATPSFGLGVDKPDIRHLIHYEIPGSIESYYQEAGRAGRDASPSDCHLLYVSADLETQMRFIEWAVPDPQFVRAVYDQLVNWKDRLPTLSIDDLRAQMSFKNKADYRLETALALLDRWDSIRWTHRDLRKTEILAEPSAEWLKPDLWAARKKSLHLKLHALVQYAAGEECRMVQIFHYFGWPNETPCGRCDRCQ